MNDQNAKQEPKDRWLNCGECGSVRAECERLRAEIAEMKSAVLMLKPMTELGIKVFNQTKSQ